MSERKNILRVEHATMQFGGVVAVDDLSMEVNEGEIVALIGPNGAGKTTAFNVITGVYRADERPGGRSCGETIVRNHPQGKMKKSFTPGEHGRDVHGGVPPRRKRLRARPLRPTPPPRDGEGTGLPRLLRAGSRLPRRIRSRRSA